MGFRSTFRRLSGRRRQQSIAGALNCIPKLINPLEKGSIKGIKKKQEQVDDGYVADFNSMYIRDMRHIKSFGTVCQSRLLFLYLLNKCFVIILFFDGCNLKNKSNILHLIIICKVVVLLRLLYVYNIIISSFFFFCFSSLLFAPAVETLPSSESSLEQDVVILPVLNLTNDTVQDEISLACQRAAMVSNCTCSRTINFQP